jgi:hypothetical protein
MLELLHLLLTPLSKLPAMVPLLQAMVPLLPAMVPLLQMFLLQAIVPSLRPPLCPVRYLCFLTPSVFLLISGMQP